MKDGRKVRVEDLVFPGLVQFVGEVLQKDEAAVRPTLNPLVKMMANEHVGAVITFAAMARTATLFLVDHTEFVEAVSSAGEPPLEVGLPPLPYPRIAVECLEDATWAMHGPDGEHHSDLELFMIHEADRGERWDVVLLLKDPQLEPGQRTNAHLLIYSIEPDGSCTTFTRGPDAGEVGDLDELLIDPERLGDLYEKNLMEPVSLPADNPIAKTWRKLPIEFAHLANARGVTIEPVDIPRPQRRRFQRATKYVHPQIYFVKIGGELVESYPGHGDREYHCRWLVRGHWVRPKNKPKHWRRAHIRGPAGAPWRGRPVYVIEPEE